MGTEKLYYSDGSLTVTETEVRSKNATIYLDKVSSVSVYSARPTRWVPLLFILPLGITLLVVRTVVQLTGYEGFFLGPMLVIVIPFVLLSVVAYLLRSTRIALRTSGGPVLIDSKLSLSEPIETLQRHEKIKSAIEDAIKGHPKLSGV